MMSASFQEQACSNQATILSVTEISSYIKKNLESSFSLVHIKGEVSNFKKQSSGHLYFSLKDAGAQISCVMFRGYTANLKRLPLDGDEVLVKGKLSVYLPRGNYQLIVEDLVFAGLGEKLLQLEKLKEKLKSLGYFDAQHKKPLPPYPHKIGIVTSPTGAAIQDMLNILQRRGAHFHIILNPVKVQGEGAKEEIARAIEQFNELNNVEVIIVGRGGGSIEDLWAFNEAIVAKAIFKSRIPVVSAVGHETDTTLSDYIADLRAPTPSAAAELVMKDQQTLIEKLQHFRLSFDKPLTTLLRHLRERLQFLTRQSIFIDTELFLSSFTQRLDDAKTRLDQLSQQSLLRYKTSLETKRKELTALNPSKKIKEQQKQLQQISRQLDYVIFQHLKRTKSELGHKLKIAQQAAEQRLSLYKSRFITKQFASRFITTISQQLSYKKERLNSLVNNLEALNPQNVLKKGYHIIFSENDQEAIISAKQLIETSSIVIQSHDGKVKANLQNKERVYDSKK